MIYNLDLQTTMIAVGLLLVIAHGIALFKKAETQAWLQRLPRSRFWGGLLLTAAATWFFALIIKIDLGEFTPYKTKMLVAIPIAYILTLTFVDEFLAVRAIGILLLLAAEPLLEAAFLRPEPTRLLLVVLAYVWIIKGLFWVGMPYLMRDQISWITASSKRWQIGCLGGLLYGVALLICSLLRSA